MDGEVDGQIAAGQVRADAADAPAAADAADAARGWARAAQVRISS